MNHPAFNVSCIVLLVLTVGCRPPVVQIEDGQLIEGQAALKITTPHATYFYQTEAGGFARIIDTQGIDWIQFHKTEEERFPASAASDYRGLPNLVFRSDDGGCGHPGFSKMTTEVVSADQIRSTSNSGKWQWSWRFHEEFAELTVEKVDPEHAYWFLYEGPIAGRFSPGTHYWGTDAAGPLDLQPDLIHGPERYDRWQTVYFGDNAYNKTFFVHMLQADTLVDLYTYMGNDKDLANDSSDGMVVFGFGRDRGATPLMTSPNTFVVGFYPKRIDGVVEHGNILRYIENL